MVSGFVSYLLVILFGIAGFCLSYYISWHKRKQKKPMVCPLKFKCDDVIHSKYSRFLGIPLEYMGMLYYAIIAVSYSVFAFSSYTAPQAFHNLVAYASLAAFLFSLYLIYIQAFKLKEWCTWCLMSAGLTALIFTVVFFF